MARRRTLRNLGLLALVLFLLSEGVLFMAGKLLESKGVFYRPVTGDYPRYLARRHPALGWPAPSEFGRGEWDAHGSRINPEFPDPETPASVSLYGDSFTWSSPVDADDAWSAVLSRHLGQRVNNFGVAGYGSDQAFLRYRENTEDRARVVVLAHLSENILRNVNQFRDLIGSHGQIGFKPRFILDEQGLLQEIPLPDLSESEYADCVQRPERYLPYETFLPGARWGPRRLTFPYTWTVLRSLGHFHVVTQLKGEPWYLPFYDEDHSAQGVQVTASILGRFVDTARQRGQTPLVVLIPTGLDLDYHRRSGRWPYQPLTDLLNERELPVLDLGPRLADALEGREIAEIFSEGRLSGHFNVEGYRLLGEIVYEHVAGP